MLQDLGVLHRQLIYQFFYMGLLYMYCWNIYRKHCF